MGLDIFIRKRGKTKENSKGQKYWTVTEVLRLSNTWGFLNLLDVENCKSECFYGADLLEIVDTWDDTTSEKGYILGEFHRAGIRSDKYYDIYAWW